MKAMLSKHAHAHFLYVCPLERTLENGRDLKCKVLQHCVLHLLFLSNTAQEQHFQTIKTKFDYY